MEAVPEFKNPTEIRIALGMAGRVMRLESAKSFSEKLKAAKDMKTYIDSFKTALKDQHKFTADFSDYASKLMSECKKIISGAESWML